MQTEDAPDGYKRVPASPLCAKAGLWPYPCHGRIELQKTGTMKGSFLCEEHAFQAVPQPVADVGRARESREFWKAGWYALDQEKRALEGENAELRRKLAIPTDAHELAMYLTRNNTQRYFTAEDLQWGIEQFMRERR